LPQVGHTYDCKGRVKVSQHQWLLRGEGPKEEKKARERSRVQKEEVNALEARLWHSMLQRISSELC
jgi:hypothetical protein